MGFYIQTDVTHGKADAIIAKLGAKEVSQAQAKAAITDPNVGVVVVVDNGPFEAEAFAFSEAEFNAFTSERDFRPKRFLTMPRQVAVQASGYRE